MAQKIINVAGKAQRKVLLSSGVNVIEGLSAGIYIVKGTKVMVNQYTSH